MIMVAWKGSADPWTLPMYPPLMLSVIFFSKSSPSEGEKRSKAMARERKTARLLRSKHHGVVG